MSLEEVFGCNGFFDVKFLKKVSYKEDLLLWKHNAETYSPSCPGMVAKSLIQNFPLI